MQKINASQIRDYFPEISELALREELAEKGHYAQFEKDSVIMEPGTYIRFMPMLITGAIRVIRVDEDEREVFLYVLSPGDTCAVSLSCCMVDKKSDIKAIAEENTEVLMIPVGYMDEWLKKYPTWKNYVMTTYQRRFSELLQTIDSIAFEKLDVRIMDYLAKRAQVSQSGILELTHLDIAKEFNSSREVVSRLLKQLEKKGLIQLGRNRIEVLL